MKEFEIKDAMQAIETLRKEVEKAVPDKAVIEKCNAALDQYEVKNAALTKEIESAKTREVELKDRVDLLEKMAAGVGGGAGDADKQKAKIELKAFEKFITHGDKSLGAEELKYLRTDNSIEGGFLAPAEYVREIIKKITEVSAVRSISRVRSTGAGKMELPIRNTLVSASWEGEGETGDDSNSTYGLEKLPLSRLTVTVPITNEELMDAAFNMESEISADITEAFNQKEGAGFVTGDSVKKPQGFMHATALNVDTRNSGFASTLNFDSILLLTGDLKTGYNPVFVMNRKTVAFLRTLKDGVGQYLWQAGNVAAGVPNQVAGYSYVEMPDMDDIGTNAFPIAFGDFRQGYLIGDSMGLSVIRDPYALKKSGKVEFTFTKRTGGMVVKGEAIKKLKCAV
jgi:HK97 family phage major capsid protein